LKFLLRVVLGTKVF